MDYLTLISNQIRIPDLTIISNQLGISILSLLTILLTIFIWEFVWKLLALWKSARNGSIVWFIILGLFNTIGILPILYIFVFSKFKCCKTIKVVEQKKKTKRK